MRKRVGIVSLDILIELNVGRNSTGKHKDTYKEINGYSVKMSSPRYAVFKKSLTCVCCGISGVFFAIEQHFLPTDHYHLNLYCIDEKGNEILMTKDHIQPRSKGGRSVLNNYQTMCVICNGNKGNKIETLTDDICILQTN